MSLQKRPGLTSFRGDESQVLAAIEVQLSSEHIRYEVQPPDFIELIAFIGGISVMYFLLGKIINHIFLRKTYISVMMDKLF